MPDSAPPWPPDPGELDPLEVLLSAGTSLFRVHPFLYAPQAPNPGFGAGGRFHFVETPEGEPVPALYAASAPGAALAETVFHDVPVRPPGLKTVRLAALRGRSLTSLRTRLDLSLVQLHDLGLDRLGLRAADLTDTDPSEYPRTRAWATALHRAGAHHGLTWMSRRYNSECAWVLFGDRLPAGALEPAGRPVPLWLSPGIDLVYEHAERAGIVVVHD